MFGEELGRGEQEKLSDAKGSILRLNRRFQSERVDPLTFAFSIGRHRDVITHIISIILLLFLDPHGILILFDIDHISIVWGLRHAISSSDRARSS